MVPEETKRRRILIKKTADPRTAPVLWLDSRSRINSGHVTPFLSSSLTNYLALGGKAGYEKVIEQWAQDIKCPWPTQWELAAVAQYSLIENGDELAVKHGYLDFIKNKLLDLASEDPKVAKKQFEDTEEQYNQNNDYSFTAMAKQLGYLDLNDESPLKILADLPFQMYVTTSYHKFLEEALITAGKKPRTGIYPWKDDLDDTNHPALYTPPKNPEREPIVYHLFGWEDKPRSLVLTENDYLDFLIRVTRDSASTVVGGNTDKDGNPVIAGLPNFLKDALAKSASPLLLGYALTDWEFRVLFKGLVTTYHQGGDLFGICIQQEIGDEINDEERKNQVKKSLDDYLVSTSKLKIYWGSPEKCMQDIRKLYDQ